MAHFAVKEPLQGLHDSNKDAPLRPNLIHQTVQSIYPKPELITSKSTKLEERLFVELLQQRFVLTPEVEEFQQLARDDFGGFYHRKVYLALLVYLVGKKEERCCSE